MTDLYDDQVREYRDRLAELQSRADATGCDDLIRHAAHVSRGLEQRGIHGGLEYWANDLEKWVQAQERLMTASR